MDVLKGYRFWEWFCNNQERYLRMRELETHEIEALCDEANTQVARYCKGLAAGFKIIAPQENDLIITAGGFEQYFDSADELVLMAPKLKEWNIEALWPPEWGFPITIYHEGLTVSSDNLWFTPVDNVHEPHKLGIEVYFKDYNPAEEAIYHSAAEYMTEIILGEKNYALDLQYLQTAQLPSKSNEYTILPMETLAEYIEMRKEQVLMN
jgi:hypothetical protein